MQASIPSEKVHIALLRVIWKGLLMKSKGSCSDRFQCWRACWHRIFHSQWVSTTNHDNPIIIDAEARLRENIYRIREWINLLFNEKQTIDCGISKFDWLQFIIGKSFRKAFDIFLTRICNVFLLVTPKTCFSFADF